MKLKYLYRAWRFRNKVEADEIEFVLSNLRPGDLAIDIGAHKGAFTYWMQKAVTETGRVVSFEPQPELAAYLRGMVSKFGWPHVNIEEKALSWQTTRKLLYRPEPEALGAALNRWAHLGGDAVEVEVDTLDNALAGYRDRPIRLIKCDVEGHELPVFRGAEAILREDHPYLMFDCESKHHFLDTLDDVFDFLRGLGYSGTFFCRGRSCPLDEFDLELYQGPAADPYAYSFLFQPSQAAA